MTKPKSKEPDVMLTARVPAKLVRALDRIAKRQRRSRSQEVILRLEASLGAPVARAEA